MSWLFSEYHLPPYYGSPGWHGFYRTILDAYREVREAILLLAGDEDDDYDF